MRITTLILTLTLPLAASAEISIQSDHSAARQADRAYTIVTDAEMDALMIATLRDMPRDERERGFALICEDDGSLRVTEAHSGSASHVHIQTPPRTCAIGHTHVKWSKHVADSFRINRVNRWPSSEDILAVVEHKMPSYVRGALGSIRLVTLKGGWPLIRTIHGTPLPGEGSEGIWLKGE